MGVATLLARDRQGPQRVRFQAMGSPCELQLFAPRASEARAVAGAVAREVARLERRYSRFRSDSFLSQINRTAAAGGSIEVDGETASLFDYASACHRESGGLFDVTSGILRRAWRRDGGLPDPGHLRALLAHVGWHRVVWSRPTLAFPEPGVEIDLGGVVKEYAADRAAALCRSLGLCAGMINLGGDVRIVGPRPDGTPWRIGIRDPRRPGALLRTLLLHEGAVASSGDYERCIEVEGVRYGHILDPTTGWPVRHLAAVSVVGALCIVAGSASTIAMLRAETGPGWLEATGLPHLWVDVEGRAGGPLARA